MVTPAVPLPPKMRPWFIRYGPAVQTAIRRYYKPIDEIVSPGYLTDLILDDPDLATEFSGMDRTTVRRAVVLCLRYYCGADWYTNRRQHQRALVLPRPVGEMWSEYAETDPECPTMP